MVFNKKQKGSVLVFSLIILSFLLVASLSIATINISEKRAVNAVSRSVVAFQIADSGLEKLLERVYNGTCDGQSLSCLASSGDTCTVVNGQAGINGSINSGTYRVTFFEPPNIPTYPNGKPLSTCSDGAWRANTESVRSEGNFNGTARAVKIDVNPV